ncbi:hypothetical protein [Paraburkholderia xenovorans]|uniref:hypothetical protein n=1 Tax=Paraburkholderia xenovorans TaxID=36873 RepID=UPI0015C546C9|nr:hypothetical protein [Paraburkholderia xenovorans]NPT36235.1 hypothetical protein [Paraburkholderia xenovorans]
MTDRPADLVVLLLALRHSNDPANQALDKRVVFFVTGLAAVDDYGKVIRSAIHFEPRPLRSRNAVACLSSASLLLAAKTGAAGFAHS